MPISLAAALLLLLTIPGRPAPLDRCSFELEYVRCVPHGNEGCAPIYRDLDLIAYLASVTRQTAPADQQERPAVIPVYSPERLLFARAGRLYVSVHLLLEAESRPELARLLRVHPAKLPKKRRQSQPRSACGLLAPPPGQSFATVWAKLRRDVERYEGLTRKRLRVRHGGPPTRLTRPASNGSPRKGALYSRRRNSKRP